MGQTFKFEGEKGYVKKKNPVVKFYRKKESIKFPNFIEKKEDIKK